MKIIPLPLKERDDEKPVPAAPADASAALVPSGPSPESVKLAGEIATLKLAQTKMDRRLQEQAQEIQALREALITQRVENRMKPVNEPPAPPPVEPLAAPSKAESLPATPPAPPALPDAPAASPAGAKELGEKVAFKRKLWDYLNHTAFETPRKSDRE